MEKEAVRSASANLNKPRLSGRIRGRLSAASLLSFAAALLVSALFLSGCASVPNPGEGGYFSLLYRKGSVIFILDVEEHGSLSRQVLSEMMSPDAADSFIERTSRLYVRFYLQPPVGRDDWDLEAPPEDSIGNAGASPAFDLIATGRYPRRMVGLSLNRDAWVKKSEPSTWWQSEQVPLQVAVPSRNLALASASGMRNLLSRVRNPNGSSDLPETVHREAETAALFMYGEYPRLGDYFDGRIGTLVSRIERFSMGLYGRSDDKKSGEKVYRITGEYRFGNERYARSFLLSLRLALLSRARQEGKEAIKKLVEKKYVRQEENVVSIEGAEIGAEDIHLLFGIFTPRI